ncbi:MAG TPA: histidine kinase dimerization/phospho-acceptor domain-containing protein [Candidatus Binatia bacterium]|nr:histidine kinase dimerization/phospho-acceptor domain-containing protein [Candidatus Binatia bacterium]
MKRILVIDESEVVRETLALILGREFAVSKRPLRSPGFPLADSREQVDLLILGLTPQLSAETANVLRFATRLPFAVLFLVESKSVARAIETKAEVACLTKPFNPYELYEKVGQLLARREVTLPPHYLARGEQSDESSRYLEFPYLGRSAASLVRRFGETRLPLLITGETGCGQDRVAAAVCRIDKLHGMRVSLDASEANPEYLAQKSLQLSVQGEFQKLPTTMTISNLDKCSRAGQSLIFGFLEEIAARNDEVRYISTARGDLLEQVYRGEFLESLYYTLATLKLKLPALRERKEDIPVLAERLARDYGAQLGLPSPTFTEEALGRLSNYLWFGNVSELESVIARTIAFYRKPRIEAGELIFDFSEPPTIAPAGEFSEYVPADRPRGSPGDQPKLEIYHGRSGGPEVSNGQAKSVDLNVVIHELAHELKNPMVTIKTFAQLLGDRYEDENFRTRFQEVVGNDIERMDELLEVMIEFADFGKPRFEKIALGEKIRAALGAVQADSSERQTRFRWREQPGSRKIQADEAHLEYILRNILGVTLSEARKGSEIEVEQSANGLAIRYLREGARVASVAHYLNETAAATKTDVLPLRVLLARNLLERNGGRLAIDAAPSDRETLRLEFLTAENRDEN